MRAISVSRPGVRSGSSRSHVSRSSSAVAVGPTLRPSGFRTPEKNSTWAPSACRVRSPTHSMWAEQSYQLAGQRVAPREPLLVVEQEALVARPHVHLVQAPLRVEVDAAGGHEPERALDLGRDRLVAAALGRGGHELLVPAVDAGQVGEPALGEGAQQVQGRGGLVVGLDEPVRVGHARGRGRRVVVHHVAAEGRQLDAVHRLGRGRAGLRELARDPSQLDDGQRAGVGHHRRHLEDDLELLADADRREVGERLGAVAGLEQERTPLGDARERGREVAGLAGEDERGQLLQPFRGSRQPALVGPVRLLPGRVRPPGGGRPGVGRGDHRMDPNGGSIVRILPR